MGDHFFPHLPFFPIFVRGFSAEILADESAETANIRQPGYKQKSLLAPLKLHTFRVVRNERDRHVEFKKIPLFSCADKRNGSFKV
jgi:hypothetical protein